MPMTIDEMSAAIRKAEAAGDAKAVAWMRDQAIRQLTGPGTPMENLGAGFDTFLTGVKQIFGQGPSDEELQEDRATKQRLAESTPGGSLYQIAGEAAPAFAIPGGTGARVLQRTLGAGRIAPAAQAAGRTSLPIAMGGSGLEAIGAGALMPTTSDESKLANMAISGGFGAGAPVLFKTLGVAARGVRDTAERAFAAVPRYGAGAAERVAERDAAAGLRGAGVDLDPARYRVQDYQPNTNPPGPRSQALGEFEPTTAAAYSGIPGQPGTAARGLAEAEKAVRGFDAGAWEARDALEAQKRWTQLDESLRGQGDIDRLTGSLPAPPYSTISPGKFDQRLYQFQQRLEQMTDSPKYVGNPAVKAAVDHLRSAIATGKVNPEALHELRKTLAKGLTGTPGLGEAGVRAAASDPYIMRLVEHIDAVMASSAYARQGTKWADWRQAYSGIMREAEGAKAEEQLRRSFVTEAGVPRRGTADTPQLGAGFAGQTEKLMNPTTGANAGRNMFNPQAQQAVADIVRDLNANGVVDRVRRAATLGGSDTAYNWATQGMMGVVADFLFLGGAGSAGVLTRALSRHNIEQQKRQILTRIMQDPAQFRQFVDAAAQRAQALAAQEGVSGGTRAGMIGAAAALPVINPEEQR